MRGAITEYIDVAQIALYAFWIFFVGLIIYLRREDKREGYPLESDRTANTDRIQVQGFPRMPLAKTFNLAHGGSVNVPNATRDPRVIQAAPSEPWPGAPLRPTGNPMLDGVGPGSYALRAETPDLTLEGLLRIVPMRVTTEFTITSRDPDPRGMSVIGADGELGGVVSDVWVDRSEPQIRYLEVQVSKDGAARNVLVPMGFVRIDNWRRCARVRSILAAQFADVPGLANPDQITLREEDRISAYYGGGTLYANASRAEPLL
jgi:photosynthetic reaction center H subunit